LPAHVRAPLVALQKQLQSFLKNTHYVLGSIWHEESNRKQRVKHLFLFFGWQVWKRVVQRPLVVKLFNGLQFQAHPDCQVSSAVLYARIPDSRDILYLRAHIRNGTLIDVGANVGLVSLLLADKVQHGVLFEPNPIAAARARANLALNGLEFEVHELALSDTTGTVELEDEGGVSTCNRTVVGFSTSLPTRKVGRTQLDKFLAQHPLPYPISAVKIDVEGHENQVLAGMMDCLRHPDRAWLCSSIYNEQTCARPCGYLKWQDTLSCNLPRREPRSLAPKCRPSRICSPVPMSCCKNSRSRAGKNCCASDCCL